LISHQEGIDKVHSLFPNVKILTAVVDPHINENKYILPGLGDFGDRYFASARKRSNSE
jgi:uracil phosphoribosyltransferase